MSRALRDSVVRELEDNLLPFWRDRSPDDATGGFIAEMSRTGVVDEDAPRGLILNSRLLWTFSALWRELDDERDLALARRAFGVLESSFRDREHGGYFWLIDPDGRPRDRTKKIYGQAFCIYALSEFHRATGDQGALDSVLELTELVDRHARNDHHGGYLETRASDWSPAENQRLSDKDMDAAKSMNNHLHLLEAFTNLRRARPTADNEMRLYELIEIFGRYILERDPDGLHLKHFFDEDWRSLSDIRAYGHDIEAAWLLGEAAEVLGDAHIRSRVENWSVDLARSVLATGIDVDGGLAYEGRGQTVVNPNRDWWCQAEAVVGFRHVFELTGDERFARAAARVWDFIRENVVDRQHGEWFWRVGADGAVDRAEPKVSAWKGPYHNVRMCLEMRRRLGGADGVNP
jgi:mannobiose 2-epimerase